MKGFPKKKSFEAWLESIPCNATIAERWHADSCPLCIFLIEQGYTRKPYVFPSLSQRDEETYRRDGVWRDDVAGTGPMPLPKWADDFSVAIDKLASVKPLDRGAHFYRAVTPVDCLWALNGLDPVFAQSPSVVVAADRLANAILKSITPAHRDKEAERMFSRITRKIMLAEASNSKKNGRSAPGKLLKQQISGELQ